MSIVAISAIGYLAAALLYALFALLLVTVWRRRRLGGFLFAAAALSIVWALLLAVQAATNSVRPGILFAAEVGRAGGWITFLVILVGQLGVRSVVRQMAMGVWVTVLIAGSLIGVSNGISASDWTLATVMIPGGLAMSLAGLMLIEQLYRNTAQEARRRLNSLVLGVGGMLAYDLFMYSQGLLLGGVDPATWLARGGVNALFVPLLVLATRRNRDWNLRIFVSRQIVFYTTTLIAVGLYLLLMSVGGYLIVRVGGSWGGVIQVIFLTGSVIVLLTLMFSGTWRARLKVFLSKHFFQNKYDHRLEWLRLVATLAEFQNSSTRQVVIKALAQIVDSPSGALWVKDEGDRSYKPVAYYNSEENYPVIYETDSIIQFIKTTGWLIDLNEFAVRRDLYGRLTLPEWMQGKSAAWLVVPLIARQDLIGLVMLDEPAVLPVLGYEDRDLLKTAGNHIAVHLAQEKSDSMLAEAQQFEAYNRLTAFLMHDLNNLIAQQSLIVKNAEKHKRNPDFVDDAIRTISNSVERMNRVMRQLRRDDHARSFKPTELRFIVSAAVDQCASRQPVPTLHLNIAEAIVTLDAEQLTMVLSHLIRNAQEATPRDGSVQVTVDQEGAKAVIKIVDTGCGMTADFVRDRLFRPFDSTKGVQGMGIGAFQAREFVRKCGGELRVESKVGAGTAITVTLPL